MGANTIKENNEPITEETQENKRTNKKKKKKYRIRMFPIWLRVIVVLILACVAVALGLMVGYGILGDGEATDIFQKETWQHVIDIVNKEK